MVSQSARVGVLCAVIALGIAAPRRAAADDVIPGHHIDRPITGLVIGTAGLGFGLTLIPIRSPHPPWQREVFGALDEALRTRFSPSAAQISDGLLLTSVAAPIFYLTGTTIEDADGDRLLIYGESLGVNFLVFQGVKYLVQRPRPYVYSTIPEVMRYVADQGDDAFLSFYSGHSATAFCAATAGAYLASASTTNSKARALAWGGGFTVAAATAALRVRAGKHFYSDVVIGALIGVVIGYTIPAMHADADPYVPSVTDVGAAISGVVGGVVIAKLLPLGDGGGGLSVDARAAPRSAQLAPLVLPGGAGIAVTGTL